MTMQPDWNRIAFAVALVVVGALVWKERLHPEILIGMLAWFMPTPAKPVQP